MHSRIILKILLRDGWKIVRTKGSHHHLKHPLKKGLVTLPHPNTKLPLGTLRSIFRQAGLSWSQYSAEEN